MTQPAMPTTGLAKSVTMWGAVAYAMLDVVEKFGAVPDGAAAAVLHMFQGLAMVATIFGLRRRLPSS